MIKGAPVQLYEFMSQAGFSFDKVDDGNDLLAFPTDGIDNRIMTQAQARLQSAMQEARRAAAAVAASRRVRNEVAQGIE